MVLSLVYDIANKMIRAFDCVIVTMMVGEISVVSKLSPPMKEWGHKTILCIVWSTCFCVSSGCHSVDSIT